MNFKQATTHVLILTNTERGFIDSLFIALEFRCWFSLGVGVGFGFVVVDFVVVVACLGAVLLPDSVKNAYFQ